MTSSPPTAEIQTARKLVGGSKLWLLTLLCLLLAVGLVWWSLPQQGTSILVSFPDGHGLQPEDTVRYRGIEVGTVESVELGESLGGVEVEVLLKPFASKLATEGTRFWVVRPELSLTRISGLETAIGHKYIGVLPAAGENKSRSYRFEGLGEVPVDTLARSGVELILRGEKMYSVSKGSAVTYRGVEIGKVFDVGLSSDASHVDVRIRILEPFRKLLSSETKFWASSGLDLDFKFGFNGGFNLDTESLETLARGGVSMLTTGQGQEVSPGDVFKLHAAADDEWLKQAANFKTTDVPLEGAVVVNAMWNKRTLLGRNKSVTSQCNGVSLQTEKGTVALFPGDFFDSLSANKDAQITLFGKSVEIPEQRDGDYLSLPVDRGTFEVVGGFQVPESAVDLATAGDLIVLRRPSLDSVCFHNEIGSGSVSQVEGIADQWSVSDFIGDREVWHGAPVVTAEAGQFVGVLLLEGNEGRIAAITKATLGN